MRNNTFKTTTAALKYSLHVIVRPFDGFYDLKHEKKGNAMSATIIFALTLLSYLLNRQYSGYFYTSYNSNNYNILIEIATVVLPFFLWIVSNWCLTTLMDGEGTMKDVYIATSYALTPIVLLFIPLTVISNVMSLGENSYYAFFYGFTFIWVGYLIFTGTMITHQYMLAKTFITCILTIVGMLIIIFIGLLFYSLLQKVIGFFLNSYGELSFRLY